LSFADGDDFFWGSKGEQFVKTPNPAKSQRFVPSTPHRFEIGHLRRYWQFVPFVGNIQKLAAFPATGSNFVDAESSVAIDVETLLKSVVRMTLGNSDRGC
jgi:hypothetical protein